MKSQTKNITYAAVIAATYAALTTFLAPISFGPVQFRIAEALTVLPYIIPQAIPGLWIGCMVANIAGGLGPIDIFFEGGITLLAAFLTYYLRRFERPIFAPIPPIILNALGVSAYLHVLISPPEIEISGIEKLPIYFLFVLTIGVGEFVVCYGLGYPLLLTLMKKFDFRKN